MLMILVCSCANTKYVEVPVTHSNTTNTYRAMQDSTFIKDSIWVHDSVYIKEKGDTVFQFRYRDRIQYLYIDKVKIDTNLVYICDTLTKSVIVEKQVEVNILQWWQKALIWVGILSVGIAAIFIYLKMR